MTWVPATSAGIDGEDSYCSWSLTLSRAALTQSSSTPGELDTPTPPTTSVPILIGCPPGMAMTFGKVARHRIWVLKLLGVFGGRLSESHRAVGLAPRIFHSMWCRLVAAHFDDGFTVAADHHGGNGISLRCTSGDCLFGNGPGDAQ